MGMSEGSHGGTKNIMDALISKKNHSTNTRPHFPAISFNHRDLLKQPSGRVKQKKFINAVNYIHFMGGSLFVNGVDRASGENYFLRVSPEPCWGAEVTCRFPEGSSFDMQNLTIENLIIDDGKSITCMPLKVCEITNEHFSAQISTKGFVFSERQSRRFRSQTVQVRVKQGVHTAAGTLEDFNSNGFRIVLDEDSGYRYDPSQDIEVELYKENMIIYSGRCRLVRVGNDPGSVVVVPFEDQRIVYKRRKLRNPRLNLIPTPKIVFAHPFSNQQVAYEISDITTSGFSVYEGVDRSLLIPGLIIHDVDILLAGSMKMSCNVQVVYSQKSRRNIRRFGIAIIDMDMSTYSKLFDILSNADDVHANFTSSISMDSLWEFFFESGFIYPKKYASLSRHKERFKKTYEVLYQKGREIFGYFTYQRNGVIYGHASIIKAYHRTWMIHHLAARPLEKKRTGLFVLKHILHYFDGLYRMPAVGMDYMIFYFRPENSFPDYFFGGFCRKLNNPKACSMDRFAHLICQKNHGGALPDGWTVRSASAHDIEELTQWYDEISGGLMIKAFCFGPGDSQGESVEEMYARAGLKRKYSLAKISYGDQTKAIVLIDESDAGANLSDLLNSIKVFVPNSRGVPWNILKKAICEIAGEAYEGEEFPVLIYPVSYADQESIPYDKAYNLWALDVRYGDDYSEHLKAKAKFSVIKFGIGYLKKKFLKS